jgi:serine/threonine-protein kinase
MALSAGTRLGAYEILSPLGAGGMGEVYRARDAKLLRDVAVKVLPDFFAGDPDRLARFHREAQVLASLNHPNIAQIHGLEEAGALRGLVMELVEGPTLAERIEQGPIPAEEALAIGKQIAEALEAAHERGIVHRDLKPANVKVRADGTVKVLDFGLAKALDADAGASNPSAAMSPTLSIHATQAGIILGTAAYMSPEQAAGKAVDRRSDLWAFGVVLLEMLTGRPAFTGETVSHVLAAVLKTDPDWSALPGDTPAAIRRLLRRCLEKDRRRRLDSAAAARLEIDEALTPVRVDVPAPPAHSRRVGIAPIAAALAGVALAATIITWAVMRQRQLTPVFPVHFTVVPTAAEPLRISPFESTLALSADGRYLVYSSRGLEGGTRASGTSGTLMVRPLHHLEARPIASSGRSPFLSPDGAWVGFFDDNDFVLKKVLLAGGTPVPICRFTGGPRGASWGEDNAIVFATGDRATGLWRVPAGGGEPTVLTTPDASLPQPDHLFPSVLPGGRGVLFTIAEPGQPDTAQVALLDSATGQHRTLLRGGSDARYVPTGHLVYGAAGTLRAVRFDLATLQVLGDPIPVLDDLLTTDTGAAYYAVSHAGTLAYVGGDAPAQSPQSLVWIDRQGREQPTKAPPRAYAAARLSPDGTRIALDVRDQQNDIWIWDLGRETLRKLTDGPALDQFPVWTPDGHRLLFASDRAGVFNFHVQAADGTGPVERLTTSQRAQFPTAITPDGSWIVGHEFGAPTGFDIFLLPLANAPLPAPAGNGVTPLVYDARTQSSAALSHDARYVAYQSIESGRFEIYVAPFPDVAGGKWRVTTEGGTRPVWSKSELFYIDGAGRLLAAPVDTMGPFAWGHPVKVLDQMPGGVTAAVLMRAYDVTPDGRRLLMVKEQAAGPTPPPAQVVVVVNWLHELTAKLPARD